jgi:ribosome-binding factor A
LNEVVLEVLADELERLSDPRLQLVTLTGVEVSPDLRHATVYYSSLDDAPEHLSALEAAAPHLRHVLGREVRVKYVPKLVFTADPAVATGWRIEEILDGIRRGRREEDHGR